MFRERLNFQEIGRSESAIKFVKTHNKYYSRNIMFKVKLHLPEHIQTLGSLLARSIDLGFSSPINVNAGSSVALANDDWHNWDGGKIGGFPIWLVPDSLPSDDILKCEHCERMMPMLLQLYAPLDEVDVGHLQAFHRVLYVFTCVNESCVNISSSSVEKKRPSVVVLRSQLADINEYFNMDGFASKIVSPKICSFCGLPGRFSCSSCHLKRYCSKVHQSLDWKHSHSQECTGKSVQPGEITCSSVECAISTGCLFPESELIVDPEPSRTQRQIAEIESLPEASANALKAFTLNGDSGNRMTDDTEGDGLSLNDEMSLDDVSQKSLSNITGAKLQADKQMQYFERRISCEPTQVVRYSRWPSNDSNNNNSQSGIHSQSNENSGDNNHDDDDDDDDDDDEDGFDEDQFGAPLWISLQNQPESIPVCEHCGSKRSFEFQVMPQIISYVTPHADLKKLTAHFLGTIDDQISLDFGVIAVYTCTQSCSSANNKYAREYAFVQSIKH
jgi:pre-rRNA-processing protein TSR4